MQARGKSRNQEAPPRAGLFVVDTASIRALYLSRTKQQEHEIMKYIVQWWDAYGMAQQSETMSLQAAQVLAASFHEEHDAQIVLVCG